MPQPEKQLDVIKVTGLAANVERAKLGLLERVKELQAEQEDRVRRRVRKTSRQVFTCVGSFYGLDCAPFLLFVNVQPQLQ